MKPRISKQPNLPTWQCKSLKLTGVGETPTAAYQQWLEQQKPKP